MHRAAPWFGASAAIIVVDQVVKWSVLGYFSGRSPVEPVTGFFNLVLACNRGAAFSLLADAPGWQTPVFTAFALVASIVIGILIVRSPGRLLFLAGLALILAGALGNVVDRLRFGCVVDFLDFHAGAWHWPAFNVADSAITIGAVLLILDSFIGRERLSDGSPTR
ncbi:MAG TPA: signal peptidase II [Burkholderiales bacterium]|jgi:signal peptidase II